MQEETATMIKDWCKKIARSSHEEAYTLAEAQVMVLDDKETQAKWGMGYIVSGVNTKYGDGGTQAIARAIGMRPSTLAKRVAMASFYPIDMVVELQAKCPNLRFDSYYYSIKLRELGYDVEMVYDFLANEVAANDLTAKQTKERVDELLGIDKEKWVTAVSSELCYLVDVQDGNIIIKVQDTHALEEDVLLELAKSIGQWKLSLSYLDKGEAKVDKVVADGVSSIKEAAKSIGATDISISYGDLNDEFKRV